MIGRLNHHAIHDPSQGRNFGWEYIGRTWSRQTRFGEFYDGAAGCITTPPFGSNRTQTRIMAAAIASTTNSVEKPQSEWIQAISGTAVEDTVNVTM